MTESILSPFHAASFLSFLLDVSLKSLPLFALAGLGCLWLRCASAASRHALWVVTVVSLLCLPAFCVLLPRWSVPVLPALAQHHAQISAPLGSRVEDVAPRQSLAMEQPPTAGVEKLSPRSSPATGSAASMSSPTPSLSAPGVSLPSPAARVMAPIVANPKPITFTSRPAAFMPTLTQLVLLIWLVGVLMVLARTLISIQAARRLVRRCQEVVSGPLANAAEQAQATLGLSFGVAVREGPPGTVVVPMTFGLLRPVVLLPHGTADWPAERLRVVMLHEVAHIKRRDWLTTMLAETVCAFYWFHPLVWLAAHRLRAESEQACDDLVLTSGVQAVDYADHLLEVVRGLKGRRGSMPAVVTMAQERDLTGRLKTILAESKNRSAATGRGLALAILAALVIVMPLAAMRPVARLNLEKSNGRDAPRMATLPGGAQVELVRVDASNPVTDTTTSFTPDGVALPKYSTSDGTIEATRLHPDWHYMLGAWTSSPGNYGVRGSYDYFVLKTNAQVSYNVGRTRIVPRGDGRGDIQITVATGNYDTLLTAPLLGTARRHLSAGETVLLSVNTHATPRLKIRGKYYPATEVSVAAPSRYVSDLSGFQVMPLRVGQKWTHLALYGVSGGPFWPHVLGRGMQHVSFFFSTGEMKAKHISSFQFLYRPVHTLVFRNVALRPDGSAARQPAPQASQMPAASPVDANGAPVVVNAVGGMAQVAKGVSLQLVGVSDQPSNSRWWRPDGTPFVYQPKVLRVNFNAVPNGTPSSHWSIFMFRLTQPKNDVTLDPWWHPEVQPEGRTPKAGFYTVDHIHGITFSGFVQKVAEGPTSLAVRLRVATGTWQTEQARIKPTQAALTIGRTVSVGQPQKGWIGSYKLHWLSPTSTRVTLTRSTKDEGEEMRVVAVDGQGRQFLPGPSVSNFVGGRIETWYPLSLPLAKIKELVMETRPYTAVDFKGVARQPFTSAAPVALPSLPAKARADQDGSTSNLHQIGLGIFQYAAAHDQHFPDAAHWMDQIIPYLVPSQITGAARRQRIDALFHDPASPKDQTWSYTYNRALSGLSLAQIEEPNKIVAVFECRQSVRNNCDSGQFVPQPGRHLGGNDYLFADGHIKWLGPEAATPLFNPIISATRREIPIRGQVYNRRTGRPLRGTMVIFSKSPETVTPGSVWPSSFTDKAGRFQSMVYPVKNYLMVLENNRFRLVGKTLRYESSGNTGSVSTQGTRLGPPRLASSDYVIYWALPHGYSLQASSNRDKATGATIEAFVPVARTGAR